MGSADGITGRSPRDWTVVSDVGGGGHAHGGLGPIRLCVRWWTWISQPHGAKLAPGLGDLLPSLVLRRIRSDSNSVTLANTLDSKRPAGSVGSQTAAPRLSRTRRAVSSSAIDRASGTEPARQSSFVTTRVSWSRHAASASRRPDCSRLVPVNP